MTGIKTGFVYRRYRSQDGFTMIEMVVSATLLITVMSMVTTLAFRVNRVWADIRHHRVAMIELSNQLEQITRLPADQLPDALKSLKPSTAAMQSLSKVTLDALLIGEGDLQRIVLRIDWQRPHPGKPIQMIAWIPATASAQEADE